MSSGNRRTVTGCNCVATRVVIKKTNVFWNCPEASEFFDNVAWWLSAVTALLSGETSGFILAWEECDMHATRDADNSFSKTGHTAFSSNCRRAALN
jgi:hypothetical protein